MNLVDDEEKKQSPCPMRATVQRWLRAIFTLDLRSLALFRIGLGLLVAVDAAIRARDIEVFYSDAGIKPRGEWVDALLTRPRPSLHMLSGAVGWEGFLLGLAVVVGVALALGWRTRVMAIAAWVLVVSVQNRNGYINTGADSVLAVYSLYACFLPLGARLSLDAKRAPHLQPADHAWLSPATVSVVLNLVIIYAFNVINKSGLTWINGTAVLQALHIDQHTTALGHFIREDARWLSKPLTWGTLLVEGSAVLLLLPRGIGVVRTVVVALIWGLHLGLASCMDLGLFSFVCMVAWLAVLPSAVWQRAPFARFSSFAGGGNVGPRWRFASVVLGWVLVCQLVLNVLRVYEITPPTVLKVPAKAIAVDQEWRMFSANPSRHDGWFVVEATLASGKVIDPFRGGAPVTWEKPERVAKLYKTSRWRKAMMENSAESERTMRRRLANWWCRDWNRSHDDKMLTIQMTFMLEETARNFSLHPKVVKQDMGRFRCPPV